MPIEAEACLNLGSLTIVLGVKQVCFRIGIIMHKSLLPPRHAACGARVAPGPTDPRLSCPMRSIGPAKRPQRNGDPVKRRLCFQVFSRATTSPATVLIYSSPAASVRLNQHIKASFQVLS